MIEIALCTPEMLEKVEPNPAERVDIRTISDLTYAIAILIDGRPIAAGGIVPLWEGVGEAWSVLSSEALQVYPVLLMRSFRRYLDNRMKDTFGRVQMHGSVENEKMLSWARSLGFANCHLLRNYGPGASGDYWMFERIE